MAWRASVSSPSSPQETSPTKAFHVPADGQNEPVPCGGFRPIPDPAVPYHPWGYTPEKETPLSGCKGLCHSIGEVCWSLCAFFLQFKVRRDPLGSHPMKSMDGWGVTGWSNSWTTLGSDILDDDEQAVVLDGYGVQRTVDPGSPLRIPTLPPSTRPSICSCRRRNRCTPPTPRSASSSQTPADSASGVMAIRSSPCLTSALPGTRKLG